MNKKEMKFYEAPICEVVELNVVTPILAGSEPTDPTLPEGGEEQEL